MIPRPGLSQTSVIAASMIVAYIVFITVRGELPMYLAIFTGKGTPAPGSAPASTPGLVTAFQPVGSGTPGVSVGVGPGGVSVGIPVGSGGVSVGVPFPGAGYPGSGQGGGGYPGSGQGGGGPYGGGFPGGGNFCQYYPELCDPTNGGQYNGTF